MFRERAFEEQIGQDGGGAVAGSDHQKDARSSVLNQAVQVGVDQVESGLSAPVPEQPGLDMGRL